MSYLVFDTETTGFPRKELPAKHPEQARVIQIAALLLDDNFKERACFHTLIKPDGWTISEGAQKVHGISMEDCEKWGLPIEAAKVCFISLLELCQFTIAHNRKFDSQMLDIEGVNISNSLAFCTMDAMTDICRLPSARGGYKWPKLHEAYSYCFPGETIDKAHDALSDCRACARIFKWLRDREAMSQLNISVA